MIFCSLRAFQSAIHQGGSGVMEGRGRWWYWIGRLNEGHVFERGYLGFFSYLINAASEFSLIYG